MDERNRQDESPLSARRNRDRLDSELRYEKKSSMSRRRRRPTLWDVKEFPYGIPMPLPGASNPMSLGPPRGSSAVTTRGTASTVSGYIPGPNDIVHAPGPGEHGALAGINIEALRKLLNPNGIAKVTPTNANNIALAPSDANTPLSLAQNTQDPEMQSTRHARRLYVGNLPADTTDSQIEDFFNRALIAAKGVESEGNPVVSVYTNLDKRFAFIETRTIREAAAALALDGVRFRDTFLRLRRPNDYNAQLADNPKPPDGFNTSILGIVSTQVTDGPNKVFIGGIPYNLTEDQIKSLLQSYGPLAAFNLIKEPSTGMSKGFAFFEYMDASVVDKACNALHGTQLGEKTLTVRRATQTSGMATHASSVGNTQPAPTGGIASGGAVSASALVPLSTRVVELRNVITSEELEDEQEVQEIREEMEDEGSKFGHLEEVFIPTPKDAKENSKLEKAIGCVYLRYTKMEEAERAHATMSGRKFGENVVKATFYNESKFKRKDFS